MRAPAEERAHGNISVKTYFKYFVAGGGYIFTSIVFIVFAFTEVSCCKLIFFNFLPIAFYSQMLSLVIGGYPIGNIAIVF